MHIFRIDIFFFVTVNKGKKAVQKEAKKKTLFTVLHTIQIKNTVHIKNKALKCGECQVYEAQ